MVMAPSYGNGGKRAAFPMGPGAAGLVMTLGDGVMSRVLIISFCSFVVLLQSFFVIGRTTGDGAAESYACAVGAISLAFSLLFLALAKFKPSTFSNWVLPKVRGELSISQVFAVFLVAWWTPAAAILTFFSPFTMTSNAYFATWAAEISAVLMLSKAFTRVQIAMKSMSDIHAAAPLRSLAGLVLASVVVLFGSIEYVGTEAAGGEATFSLITGIVSAVLSVLTYYAVDRKKVGAGPKKALSALFSTLWFVALLILTFDGPFNATGNGYFGTWFAFFCSVSFAYREFVGGDMPLGSSVRSAFNPFDDVEDSLPPAGSNVV